MGFLYHEFVGSKSFDVHAYFQDLFIGGKFYQFFPIDAAFYDSFPTKLVGLIGISIYDSLV